MIAQWYFLLFFFWKDSNLDAEVTNWPFQHFLRSEVLNNAAAAKSLQSCLTLCDPMDCSLPGSSVHGIFQARVLELGAIAFGQPICWLFTICYSMIATEEYRRHWFGNNKIIHWIGTELGTCFLFTYSIILSPFIHFYLSFLGSVFSSRNGI